MKKRYMQLNARLTKKEHERLIYNAAKAQVSISEYIRMLISGYVPKECPPLAYAQLMERLNQIYSNPQFRTAEFRQLLLQIQAEITLPERTEQYGNYKNLEG